MEEYESLSLRTRRKKQSVSLSCCFSPGYHHHQRADSFDAPSSSVIPSPTNRLSPSTLKGRCKNLMSRMGRHRRHSSADFSYDPLSYSLNFQDNDDPSSDHYDEFPVRSFASRLPLSPPGSRRSNLTTLIPPCSPMQKTAMVRTTSQLGGSSSRAAAVAEVRKSLEEEEDEVKPWIKLEEMRSLDEPKTPRMAERRKNVDLLKPTRMAAPAPVIVRRSYDYDYEYEDVSPALVVSPTRRQVLVELC